MMMVSKETLAVIGLFGSVWSVAGQFTCNDWPWPDHDTLPDPPLPDDWVCDRATSCSGRGETSVSWNMACQSDVFTKTRVCECDCDEGYQQHWSTPCVNCDFKYYRASADAACTLCVVVATDEVPEYRQYILPGMSYKYGGVSLAAPDCLSKGSYHFEIPDDNGDAQQVSDAGVAVQSRVADGSSLSPPTVRLVQIVTNSQGGTSGSSSSLQRVTVVPSGLCDPAEDVPSGGLHLVFLDTFSRTSQLYSFVHLIEEVGRSGSLSTNVRLTFISMLDAPLTKESIDFSSGMTTADFYTQALAKLSEYLGTLPLLYERMKPACDSMGLENPAGTSVLVLFGIHSECADENDAELKQIKADGVEVVEMAPDSRRLSEEMEQLASHIGFDVGNFAGKERASRPGAARRAQAEQEQFVADTGPVLGWAPFYMSHCGMLGGLVLLAQIASERCDGSTELTFYPRIIADNARSVIVFPRGCPATECCFGLTRESYETKDRLEVCVPFVMTTDAGTHCAMPLVGDKPNGFDPPSVLLKNGAVVMSGKGDVQIVGGSRGRLFELSRWSLDQDTQVWSTEPSGTYEAQRPIGRCCDFVALGLQYQVLGSISDEFCPTTQSEVVTDISNPTPADVANINGKIRTIAMRCWNPDQTPVTYENTAGLVAPMPDETFSPTPLIKLVVSEPATWLADLLTIPRLGDPVVVNEIETHYRCPIVPEEPMPRQLWRAIMRPEWLRAGAAECFRGSLGSAVGAYPRCCYDGNGIYMTSWPSRIVLSPRGRTKWLEVEDEQIEQTFCPEVEEVCNEFQNQRPAVAPTNNAFSNSSKWMMPRPAAGGWGDPHCQTADGFGYECNFHGEALWAGCHNLTVHAIAETVSGGGSATIITKFAVRYFDETLQATLDPSVSTDADNETGLPPNRFTVKLDGEVPEEGAAPDELEGRYITMRSFNNEMTIEDPDGSTVTANFLKQLIVLQVSLADSCRGEAIGLCGNNNADPTDDLIVRNTNPPQVLAADSSSADIYTTFVKSYLIQYSQDSLFTSADFVAADVSFTPAFVDDIDTTNCPAACNGDRACCFDAEQGGEEFAEAFQQGTATIAAALSKAVGFNDNLRPGFSDETPTLLEVRPGSPVSLQYMVSDRGSVGESVQNLTCSVCQDVNASLAAEHNVVCTVTGLETMFATLAITADSLPSGNIICVAKDDLELNATAITTVTVQRATQTSTTTTTTMTTTTTQTETTVTETVTSTTITITSTTVTETTITQTETTVTATETEEMLEADSATTWAWSVTAALAAPLLMRL